jgi:hypothetical protein
VLIGCVRNTRSLYRTNPNPRMRRKTVASNAMVLKRDRKLLKLAMEEVEGLSCQKDVGCVRVLTKKHLHDLEGIKGDCRPQRLCHLLVSSMQNCTRTDTVQDAITLDPPVIFKYNFAKPER